MDMGDDKQREMRKASVLRGGETLVILYHILQKTLLEKRC